MTKENFQDSRIATNLLYLGGLLKQYNEGEKPLEKSELEKLAKNGLIKMHASKNPAPNIISADKYWTIKGVNYRGKIGTWKLAKELSPAMTQEQFAQQRIEAMTMGGFYCGDLPSNIALMEAVMNADNLEARDFMSEAMREYWLNTQTEVIYKPKGKLDKIVHNIGIPDEEYFYDANIVNPDGWLQNIPDKDILPLLTGRDYSQLNRIFQFINGINGYLWRFNSKPKNEEKRVVRLDAASGRLYLDCGRYPHNVHPAFWVVQEG